MTDDYPMEDGNTPSVDDKLMEAVLQRLNAAMTKDPEDDEQESLVTAVQETRAFILKYSMGTYLNNPKNSKLLEGVISLIAGMEKSVRDDRKEKSKKKEKEDDAVSFNQMLEAMKDISAGKIQLPVFDISSFILDPDKSLVGELDINPISDDELAMGNTLVDIDGKPM